MIWKHTAEANPNTSLQLGLERGEHPHPERAAESVLLSPPRRKILAPISAGQGGDAWLLPAAAARSVGGRQVPFPAPQA